MLASHTLQTDNSTYIEISQAFITIDDQFLMQLRDFNPFIVYPGHWGFFGGHWEPEETAEAAMSRELQEELHWQPQSLTFLGILIVEGNRRIHAYHCPLDVELQTLDLQEGQEIGAFTMKEIDQAHLYSKQWQQSYPITPISAKAIQYFFVNRVRV